jgi:polar amino acid transport system ATP-binding protein
MQNSALVGGREGESSAASPRPIIEIDRISKSFGQIKVLDELSFTVGTKEKLALIGPSGSGKTTILRILMTLESIDSGHIKISGEQLYHIERNGKLAAADEAHLHKMRKSIGMVFQQFNLFPHLSILENLALAPILVRGVPRRDSERRALELLDMVGLADKAKNMPVQLSGGQKQRAAIARALALQPKIMLFDEVTSALDPELVEEVLNVMRRLATQSDMTMLLVTHEMSFARDFADRVLFFDRGKIVEEGAPEKIFRNPQNERTQTFLKKIVAAGHRV